jgi:hypothetical protein
MNQLSWKWVVHLAPQPSDMHVNHVVHRSDTGWRLPNIAGKHFTRDDLALMPQQVFKKLEIPPVPDESER